MCGWRYLLLTTCCVLLLVRARMLAGCHGQIGVVGWITPTTGETSRDVGGVKFTPIIPSVKACLALLKKEHPKLDFIIGLSHSGACLCAAHQSMVAVGQCLHVEQSTLRAGMRQWATATSQHALDVAQAYILSFALSCLCVHMLPPPKGYEDDLMTADAVPGLDVIVGGHSHTFLYTPVTAGPIVARGPGIDASNCVAKVGCCSCWGGCCGLKCMCVFGASQAGSCGAVGICVKDAAACNWQPAVPLLLSAASCGDKVV
jgi:hypothetical protein